MSAEDINILIIDDTPTNIQILSAILRPLYTIFFATNGRDGLQIAEQKAINLILLDIMMPEMDGYVVCQRLKNNPKTSDIPVIFITAMAETSDEKKGLDMGAVDYITKPIVASIVMARVKTHLDLKSHSQKLLESYEQLKQSQATLLHQAKMASIGRLAAGVAHEINNPMGFISSNLNTLQKYVDKFIQFIEIQADILASLQAEDQVKEARQTLKLDFVVEDSKDLLQESIAGVSRVAEIVRDLKGFSQVDMAKIVQADINDCLESTLKIVMNKLEAKANIYKEYGALPLTFCNAQEINQVFLNILINAGQAIEKQGDINIRTYAEEGLIKISIADNGRGISDDNIEHIFEPFFTTKDVGEGTGLGLSICYDIVKKHGGKIEVESQAGKGSRFIISLPIKEKE